jgi:uncharacterized protein (TIGR02646 family)
VIPVQRPELTDAQWKAWREQARGAMDQLVNHYHLGDDVELQDQFYKAAMPFLLMLFHGKCAYCETVISSNQPGDVEHYRPKGRIRDQAGKVLKVIINNTEIEHPGYWWLAYDWRNLLPSCIDCNRRRRHGEDNVAAGKAEYFEVRGKRAVLPTDDLSQEHALLLDPSSENFDPKQHFEFMEDGTIKPKTEEARYTCELLGLNLRERLVAERAKAYLQAKQAFRNFVFDAPTATPAALEIVRQQINDLWQGNSAYSAFARESLESVRARFQQNTGVPFPLPLP